MAWEAIKKDKVDEGSIQYGGTLYDYDVIAASHLTAVPYFVGYPKSEYLFISDAVPQKWRRPALVHEIICNTIKQKMTGCMCCAMAAAAELRLVDVTEISQYAAMRATMFRALILRNQSLDDPNREFIESLLMSHDFFNRFVLHPLTPIMA